MLDRMPGVMAAFANDETSDIALAGISPTLRVSSEPGVQPK